MEKLTKYGVRICLLLMALAAPLSIAATQTAWAFGLLFWVIRSCIVKPRPAFEKLDLAIYAFVGLSLISSFFSYEPGVSLRKMVAVSLVTIVYLAATNLKERRMLHQMLVLLLAGCFIACMWTFATLAVGKNLKVTKLSSDSPLRAAGIEENDTILTARGESIQLPGDLGSVFAEWSGDEQIPIKVYRHELLITYNVPRAEYRDWDSLGILGWARGRDTRASGFFGHYTTFAEALQLLASVAAALLIVVPGGPFTRNRVLLGLLIVSAGTALFLSLTRASWLSFLISISIITFIGASRRIILICAVIAIPVVIGGLIFLQQKRQVGFFDSGDGSTKWRQMVWRESFNVLTSSPRHLVIGIGMDSIKTHWQDWGMFDNGHQPLGHLHNVYLQIAFERGLPTLIAWLAWMAFYLSLLWKNIRDDSFDWPARGLLIGAFGGTVGFLASGVVHYNWGDSEIVMILYLIMGMSLAVVRGRGLSEGDIVNTQQEAHVA
jgi:hypothetical protein